MDFNEDSKNTPSKKMTSSLRPFTRTFGTALAESARVRRFVLFHQGGDALGQVIECTPGIAWSRFVDRRMGYFHWGSPPQCFELAFSIVAEDHCPVLPSAPPCRDKLSPVLLHSYIGNFHNSLEFDHLDVVLDVSSRSTPSAKGSRPHRRVRAMPSPETVNPNRFPSYQRPLNSA